MRKFNISRKLYEEISKGNIYILKDGNCVSKEEVLKRIKNEYLKSVSDGSVDMSLSYSDYMKYQLNRYVKCDEIIKMLRNKFGIDYL